MKIHQEKNAEFNNGSAFFVIAGQQFKFALQLEVIINTELIL